MDADVRDRRIRELELENARLREALAGRDALIEQLRQLIKQLQQRIEPLERAAARSGSTTN